MATRRSNSKAGTGCSSPAKTPKEIIDRLHKEAVAAAKHPDTVKRFADLAAESVGSTPAEQDAIVKRQAAQFRPIILTIKLE